MSFFKVNDSRMWRFILPIKRSSSICSSALYWLFRIFISSHFPFIPKVASRNLMYLLLLNFPAIERLPYLAHRFFVFIHKWRVRDANNSLQSTPLLSPRANLWKASYQHLQFLISFETRNPYFGLRQNRRAIKRRERKREGLEIQPGS